jgi:hypothetical protein
MSDGEAEVEVAAHTKDKREMQRHCTCGLFLSNRIVLRYMYRYGAGKREQVGDMEITKVRRGCASQS